MKKTTVADIGYSLPIGAPGPTGRYRGLGFKRWTAHEELELGKLREQEANNGNPALFASHVLGHMLTHFADLDFADLPHPRRALAVSNAYAADVYHAWVQLRREALGDELALSLACRNGHPFEFMGDLASLEVGVVTDEEEVAFGRDLRDGLEFAGKTVRTATMEPVRWRFYENVTRGTKAPNTHLIKVRLVAASIVALDGEPVRLTEGQVLGLSKFDLEHLAADIGARQPGPDLTVAEKCPQCGVPVRDSIQWVYDPFFSVPASSDGAR